MCEWKAKTIIKRDWKNIQTVEKYFSGGFYFCKFHWNKIQPELFKWLNWQCFSWSKLFLRSLEMLSANEIATEKSGSLSESPRCTTMGCNWKEIDSFSSVDFFFFLLSPQPESGGPGLAMKKWVKIWGEITTLSLALWYSFDKYKFILTLSALTDPFGSLKSQGLQKSF